MWSSRLFWKIFLVYAALHLALVTGCVLVVYSLQRPFAIEQTREALQLTSLAAGNDLAKHLADDSDADSDDRLQRQTRRLAETLDTRLTVVDAAGRVLADSHENPIRMANHLDRPEIERALRGEAAFDHRRSGTLGVSMAYLATPVVRDGKTIGCVRAAKAMRAIDRHVASVGGAMLAILLTIGALSIVATYAVVGRILRPLVDLTGAVKSLTAPADADRTASELQDDELGAIGAAFTQLQSQLAERVEQLEENNQRLMGVMSNMMEGVVTVDADEKIVLANEASGQLLGFVAADAERRPLWEVTRNRFLQDAVAEAFATGEIVRREFETTGFPRRTLALRASRLSGEPTHGVMIVLHDVSELRRLENLRREFVANVSHELKTPLSSIKAYAETLRMGAVNDPENNLTFVGHIEEQADRLHQLILDLLQIARMEAGQQVFEITNVPIGPTVDGCVKQHAATAAARRIALVVDRPPEEIAVRADEEGLRTILNNLVDNAVKYTPESGRVTIAWRADAGQVVIEVRDTGIGIPKQHHARIFERFYRVDKARSRELGGTGLGLSIVKHLSQSFGGTVGVESQPREGTTFRVALPRADVRG